MSIKLGDEFAAEIYRIFGDNRGIVKKGTTTVTIGPVEAQEGDPIKVKFLGNPGKEGDYGLCLTQSAQADGYDEYKERLYEQLGLIADEIPKPGEITLGRITDIRHTDIGVIEKAGRELVVGPTTRQVGGLVEIEGYSSEAVRLVQRTYRGDNYDVRFALMVGDADGIPFEVDEEFEGTIREREKDRPVAKAKYKGVDVEFEDAEVRVGQVVRGRIGAWGPGVALGEILEKTDEIRPVPGAGVWARLPFLEEVSFDGDDTLLEFASRFIGIHQDQLADDEDLLCDAIVAEAFRYCVAQQVRQDDAAWPRIHVNRLRHWTVRKLETILGDPMQEDADDWFRGVLDDRRGATLADLGELVELSRGFWTVGPTRAVPSSSEEWLLVSAVPTTQLTDAGLTLHIHGLSRFVRATTEEELKDKGIIIQEVDDYTRTGERQISHIDDLRKFWQDRGQDWGEGDPLTAYEPHEGFDLSWGDDPAEVEAPDGTRFSLWRHVSEYGYKEYYLRVRTDHDDRRVEIPAWYHRQICLLIDQLADRPRGVKTHEIDGEMRVSCDFIPPGPQTRWLIAIGAGEPKYENMQIHWQIPKHHMNSVEQVFEGLPVRYIKSGELG